MKGLPLVRRIVCVAHSAKTCAPPEVSHFGLVISTTVAVSQHTCLISLTKGPVVTSTVGFASLLHVKVCCVAGRNMYAPLACPDTWSPCMIMTGKESDQ